MNVPDTKDLEHELEAIADATVTLNLTGIQAIILLTHLQIALRYTHTIPSSQIARKIAFSLQEAVATTPALKALIARGWRQQEQWTLS